MFIIFFNHYKINWNKKVLNEMHLQYHVVCFNGKTRYFVIYILLWIWCIVRFFNKHLYLNYGRYLKGDKKYEVFLFFFVWQQKCYWKWLWLGWLGWNCFLVWNLSSLMSAKYLIWRSYSPTPTCAHLFRIRLMSFVLRFIPFQCHSPSLVLIIRYYAIDMGQHSK